MPLGAAPLDLLLMGIANLFVLDAPVREGNHQAAGGCQRHGSFTLAWISRDRPHCL